MLMLNRKVGEKIYIDDDIVIVITRIANGTVQLGFEAEENIIIDREEIYQKKKAAKNQVLTGRNKEEL
jgi:carbon storage regulator